MSRARASNRGKEGAFGNVEYRYCILVRATLLMIDWPPHAILLAVTMPIYRYEVCTGLFRQEICFQLKLEG